MLVLDTNVLSELLRPNPEPRVVIWLENQPRQQLFTTAISRAEVLYGIQLLPKGIRRRKLMEAAKSIFDEDLADHVLSFDSAAADCYAEISASRRHAGRPISQFDAVIAGIASAHQAAIVTRNVRDFEDCGISLQNPWTG